MGGTIYVLLYGEETFIGNYGNQGKGFSSEFERNHEFKVQILFKMANFKDFPPIFCQTADFLPGGGRAPESL